MGASDGPQDLCALCGQPTEHLVALRENGVPVTQADGTSVLVCDWSQQATYQACLSEGKKHQARLDEAAFAALGLRYESYRDAQHQD